MYYVVITKEADGTKTRTQSLSFERAYANWRDSLEEELESYLYFCLEDDTDPEEELMPILLLDHAEELQLLVRALSFYRHEFLHNVLEVMGREEREHWEYRMDNLLKKLNLPEL